MPRECWLWFHYYTTKRARSARVKKRRKRLENEKEDERDCDAYETANLEGYGKKSRPSSSHVCLSRFEAARGFPPPAHPAIALLPVHNTPRRQQSRWLLPSLPSASSLPRRSRPSVASRSARARPVRPSRSRHPRPSARVWIEPTRKADARRDFDGASPTSRPARPPALARDSYARLPARAPHARALLIAPWLTASLPALGSARGASPSPPPSQPRLPARRPAA